jgi:glycosyltransferase involved in cell wall biosynthesis
MPDFYQRSHAFLFTSLQDTTGMVTVEAMANGRPVVCLDHQGAAVVVTQETGIKVPVGEQREVVQGFADALQRLAEDRELCARLGALARRRAGERYTWEHKRAFIDRIYSDVSGRGDVTETRPLELAPGVPV